jgi:hypothetical protein
MGVEYILYLTVVIFVMKPAGAGTLPRAGHPLDFLQYDQLPNCAPFYLLLEKLASFFEFFATAVPHFRHRLRYSQQLVGVWIFVVALDEVHCFLCLRTETAFAV